MNKRKIDIVIYYNNINTTIVEQEYKYKQYKDIKVYKTIVII